MLASVQILRAVAALLVLVMHASQQMVIGLDVPGFRALQFGAAGVDLFFVISGFIMVWSCRTIAGRPGASGDFLLRRLIRIVPLYWLVTTVFLLSMLAIWVLRPSFFAFRTDIANVLASYLFIPWLNPAGVVLPVFAVGWTLNFEMFFYVIFAALLVLPLRRAVAVLTIGFLALVAVGQAVPGLPIQAEIWASPMLLEFVAGAWLGLARLGGLALPGWLRALLIAAGFLALAATDLFLPPEPSKEARLLAWGLPSVTIMAGVTLGGDVPARGAAMRLLVLLGDASYAIYLMHFFVISGMRPFAVLFRDVILTMPWVYVTLLGLGALAVSVATHLLVERPIQRALLDRYKRRKLATARPAAP